jgi:outer membrane murein-binding lipoprotein Lpp
MKKTIFIVFLMIVLLAGCGDNKKKESGNSEVTQKPNQTEVTSEISTNVDEDLFIDYYVEVAKITEKYSDNTDSLQQKMDELHRKMGVTREDIKAFQRANYDSVEKWEEVWGKIEKKVD